MTSRTARGLLLCVLVVPLAACATAKVYDLGASESKEFQPSAVWVEDFEISADMQKDVELREEAEGVMKVVKEATVKKLIESGYPAQAAPSRVEDEDQSRPAETLVVGGRFDKIDDGNVFARVLIGFGLGATHLHSSVMLDRARSEDETPLFKFEVRAKGSRMPGLILPVGLASEIGLLINGLLKGVGEFRGPLAGDARRMGEALGERLAEVFRDDLHWAGQGPR